MEKQIRQEIKEIFKFDVDEDFDETKKEDDGTKVKVNQPITTVSCKNYDKSGLKRLPR